ncbi:MAG: hypothetical protein R6U15_07550 [Candidatus Izemoplasmatales bacterium]
MENESKTMKVALEFFELCDKYILEGQEIIGVNLSYPEVTRILAKRLMNKKLF